jgi:uncharacterized protein
VVYATLKLLAPDATERIFGPPCLTYPLYLLAVWAPAVSGLVLVWHRLGRSRLRGFLNRLGMARMPASAWLLLLAGIPAIAYAGAAVSGTAGDNPVSSPWYAALPALAQALFLAGTVEELGWRGVALPLAPADLRTLRNRSERMVIRTYVAGLVALSVIMTWFLPVSSGSILVAWVVHFQAMNPLVPDAPPWGSLSYAIAAMLIVIVNRPSMLRRDGAVTGLLRSAEGDRSSADEAAQAPAC